MAEIAKYKRILLKLSGESFSPSGERGISMDEVVHISQQVHEAQQLGCQIAIVIGGGNILRGSQCKANNQIIEEATAHYMGMMATVINGLALQDALDNPEVDTIVLTSNGGGFTLDLPLPERQLGEANPTLATLTEAIATAQKPVVAALRGCAADAGLELALAAAARHPRNLNSGNT